MSYDISLYVKSFLVRALTSGLGDWRDADPIPAPAVQSLTDAAEGAGFKRTAHAEFTIDTEQHLAQLNVHRGELAFTVPYGDRLESSVQLCTSLARSVAEQHGLAVWDPQGDEPIE